MAATETGTKHKTNNGDCCGWTKRHDVRLWLAGIVYLLAIIGLMFLVGGVRGWDAWSPYTHNTSVSSQQRFWPEPLVPEPGVRGRGDDTAAGRWYYWKLPPTEATFWTRLPPWLLYVVHLTLTWLILYWIQRIKNEMPSKLVGKERYRRFGLHRANFALFAVMVVFHVLHLAQTHATYDGLAQDVSVSSSQGSVIAILIFVLLIEYKERGILLGWPTGNSWWRRKVSIEPVMLVRKFHGYGFAWGAIYTFWYHPMENTMGHAFGFAHTGMFMLQASLVFTELHTNKYWRFVLETWVTIHGALVAVQTGNPDKPFSMWPMFLFGFLFCVFATQLYGLPFWRRFSPWIRIGPFVVYLAVTVTCYGAVITNEKGQKFVRLYEIINIPLTYYLYFLIAYTFTSRLVRISKCCQPSSNGAITDSTSALKGDADRSQDNNRDYASFGEVSTVSKEVAEVETGQVEEVRFLTAVKDLVSLRNIVHTIGFVAVYASFILASLLVEQLDWEINLIVLMVVLISLFIPGQCISFFFLRRLIFGQPKQ